MQRGICQYKKRINWPETTCDSIQTDNVDPFFKLVKSYSKKITQTKEESKASYYKFFNQLYNNHAIVTRVNRVSYKILHKKYRSFRKKLRSKKSKILTTNNKVNLCVDQFEQKINLPCTIIISNKANFKLKVYYLKWLISKLIYFSIEFLKNSHHNSTKLEVYPCTGLARASRS